MGVPGVDRRIVYYQREENDRTCRPGPRMKHQSWQYKKVDTSYNGTNVSLHGVGEGNSVWSEKFVLPGIIQILYRFHRGFPFAKYILCLPHAYAVTYALSYSVTPQATILPLSLTNDSVVDIYCLISLTDPAQPHPGPGSGLGVPTWESGLQGTLYVFQSR